MEDDARLNNDDDGEDDDGDDDDDNGNDDDDFDDEDDDDDPHSAASASVSLSRARKCVSSPPEREQLCNASFQELAQNMKNKNIGNQSAIQTKI